VSFVFFVLVLSPPWRAGLVLDFNTNSRESAGVSPRRVGRCICFADASSVFPPAPGLLTAQPREKGGGGLPAGSVWPPSVALAFQPEFCPQATPLFRTPNVPSHGTFTLPSPATLPDLRPTNVARAFQPEFCPQAPPFSHPRMCRRTAHSLCRPRRLCPTSDPQT
jgi:hypothetical protein